MNAAAMWLTNVFASREDLLRELKLLKFLV